VIPLDRGDEISTARIDLTADEFIMKTNLTLLVLAIMSSTSMAQTKGPQVAINGTLDASWDFAHASTISERIMKACSSILTGKSLAIAPPLVRGTGTSTRSSADSLYDVIQSAMAQRKKEAPGMVLLERSALGQAIRAMKSQTSDLFDGETAKKLGRLASTDYLILMTIRESSIESYNSRSSRPLRGVGVDWRLVSGATGEILEAGSIEFPRAPNQ
jgi:hypothetical protein